MANVFKNDEQRKRWNEYNNKYSKENYRTFTIKLNRKSDKELIDYLESTDCTATQLIKSLIREKVGVESNEESDEESDEFEEPEQTKRRIAIHSKSNQTNNIRRLRVERGVTQTELGEVLGVTKQALSLNETGRVSRKMAKKIADYFGVSILEVMGLDAFEYMPTNEEEKQYLIALLNQLEF